MRAGRPQPSNARDGLTRTARGSGSLLYPIIKEALGELATVGEVSDTLREVFGQYRLRKSMPGV